MTRARDVADQGWQVRPVLVPAKAATGTAVDFTGIPSWVTRITAMFAGVGKSGSSFLYARLGAGEIPVTTGYTGALSIVGSAAAVSDNFTVGFRVYNGANTAYRLSGAMTFYKIDGNVWIGEGVLGLDAEKSTYHFSGKVDVGGTLDMIRFTAANGTDGFSAGIIGMMYE